MPHTALFQPQRSFLSQRDACSSVHPTRPSCCASFLHHAAADVAWGNDGDLELQCHETCRACGFGNSIDPNDRTGAAAAAAINDNPSACVACKDPFVKVDADPYFGDATGCALTCLTNPAPQTHKQNTAARCCPLSPCSALQTTAFLLHPRALVWWKNPDVR